MLRFLVGLLVGTVVAASIAWTGMPNIPQYTDHLSRWTGEGAREGLFYSSGGRTGPGGMVYFFECRPVGEGKLVPPSR
jgi:hypothetical protein